MFSVYLGQEVVFSFTDEWHTKHDDIVVSAYGSCGGSASIQKGITIACYMI